MNGITQLPREIFSFGSKAQTLGQLGRMIGSGKVLPIRIFSVAEWRLQSDAILDSAATSFGNQSLIVRSSCGTEDLSSSSAAGMYTSVLNVVGKSGLRAAIDTVVDSYGAGMPTDEVFIQPMALGVTASGVAMTCDPDSGLPYFVINYVEGGDTAAVTAGGSQVRAFTAYKRADASWPPALAGLQELLREVEAITGCAALDIEFATTAQGPLLFQVRPMTALDSRSSDQPSFSALHATLKDEERRLVEFAAGARHSGALLGIMPDWNPAEMIGVKPRPLSFSLYKELITDVNWSSARFRYGYRDMRHRRLMFRFCGTPYICIPRSIMSFMPAALPRETAEAIVATCCDYLATHRHLHDKLEFAVVPTCYTPSLELGTSPFEPVLSSLNDTQRALYVAELKNITEQIISGDGPFFNDLQLLPQMQHRIEEFRDMPGSGLHVFRKALFAAKVVGELFSGAARAAFVATAILKSVEQLERVTPGFTDALVASVHTMGKQVADDFQTMDKAAFLQRHGHIRPGTYDIRVPRCDEEPDAYFDWDASVALPKAADGQGISRHDLAALDETFRECGLAVQARQFVRFAVAAIAARERVKYIYSALVSEALRRLCAWGADHGLTREDLSFLTLPDLDRLSEQAGPDWQGAIESNRAGWAATRNVRAPEIICTPLDLLCHTSTMAHPSFITRQVVTSDVAVLSLADPQLVDLTGKIVLIENADPGYDWIFTHRIGGFITAYGGENSHMSIRSREFGIPAAIGVGETMFRTLCSARRLVLDCAGQRVQVLK